MIRIKNLTKDLGKRKGIFDVSFEVEDGEVFGLLREKGAGKTTLDRLLMGLFTPSGGKCVINGKNCFVNPHKLRDFVGYLPEGAKLPGSMTGLGFLRFLGELKGSRNLERGLAAAKRMHLEAEKKISQMEADERQLLQIAGVLMGNFQVLILDEPMKELKPKQENRVMELLREEKGHGKTIILTSDRYEVVERICDRVGMLRDGMLVNVDDIGGVRAKKSQSYVVTFATEQDALRFVQEEFQVGSISGSQVSVRLQGEMIPLIRALGNYPVVAIETVEQELDELFVQFYGGGGYA
mgnify:CR=1 FL=1